MTDEERIEEIRQLAAALIQAAAEARADGLKTLMIHGGASIEIGAHTIIQTRRIDDGI